MLKFILCLLFVMLTGQAGAANVDPIMQYDKTTNNLSFLNKNGVSSSICDDNLTGKCFPTGSPFFTGLTVQGEPLISFTGIDGFALKALLLVNSQVLSGSTFPYAVVVNTDCVATVGCVNYYSEILVHSAGPAWAAAFNMIIDSTSTSPAPSNVEIDTTNNSAVTNPTGLLVSGNIGSHPSNVGVSVFPGVLNGGIPLFHKGFGCFHALSVDQSCFEDLSNAANSVALSGTHSGSSIVDNSTSANGIWLNGAYTNWQIIGANNFSVDPQAVISGRATSMFHYTIATLPTCNVGSLGQVRYVTDTVAAAAPTYHGAVAGGGAFVVSSPVYCDGGGWKWD